MENQKRNRCVPAAVRIAVGMLLMLLTLVPLGTVHAAEPIKGIDVSRWQGNVNWEKVKKSGVQFVMLGIGRYRNGTRIPDTNFEYNISHALEQGIDVGVYLYSEATTVQAAREEAQFVLDQIDGYKISYPVAFDIEDDAHRKLTTKQRTDITIAFLEVIEKAGYYPMIYASENWLNESMDLNRLKQYDKWVARWGKTVSFKPLSMWQYSSTGRVNGISGAVDLDYSYKDYAKLITPRMHAEKTEVKAGWQKSGTHYYYIKEDGSRAKKGWLTVGGKTYYLDGNGFRVTGWQKIGGKTYYFVKSSGIMKTGWLKLNGNYYYLKKNGQRATGWVKVDGEKYYLKSNGTRAYGWLTLKGKKYLLGTKSGKMCMGWTKYQGKYYYFSTQTGQMRKGWLTFGSKKYYVNSKGVRVSGWNKIKGKWYYFNKKDGVMKRSCKVGKYVFDKNGVCKNYKK